MLFLADELGNLIGFKNGTHLKVIIELPGSGHLHYLNVGVHDFFVHRGDKFYSCAWPSEKKDEGGYISQVWPSEAQKGSFLANSKFETEYADVTHSFDINPDDIKSVKLDRASGELIVQTKTAIIQVNYSRLESDILKSKPAKDTSESNQVVNCEIVVKQVESLCKKVKRAKRL